MIHPDLSAILSLTFSFQSTGGSYARTKTYVLLGTSFLASDFIAFPTNGLFNLSM